MTATGHAIVGAAIVSKIPDLRIALPLALLSHFLGDLLPHWDTGTYWKTKGMKRVFGETLIDLSVGYGLVILIFIMFLHQDPTRILWGVLFGQLPDFLEIPYFFLQWKFAPFSWIDKLQHVFHQKMGLPWGLVDQVVVALLFIAWSYR